MENKRFVVIMASLAAIVILAIIFDRCQERNMITPTPVSIQSQTDSVKAKEFRVQPIIDSLNTLTGQLKEKDSINKKSLSFLQSENKRLAKLAEAHIDSMGLYEPPDSNTENDYAGNVKEIIANCAASDSACNETIKILDAINVTQGNTIVLKDSSYKVLKTYYNIGIEQQKYLTLQNTKLEKKEKRKSTFIKILAGIGIVLTGIIIAK